MRPPPILATLFGILVAIGGGVAGVAASIARWREFSLGDAVLPIAAGFIIGAGLAFLSWLYLVRLQGTSTALSIAPSVLIGFATLLVVWGPPSILAGVSTAVAVTGTSLLVWWAIASRRSRNVGGDTQDLGLEFAGREECERGDSNPHALSGTGS